MTQSDIDYAQIFNLTPAPLAILDRSFCYVAANDAYCALLLQPLDALLGRTPFDLFPETPEREKLITDAFRKALSGQTATLDEVHYAIPNPADPDGPKLEIWWTVHCTPVTGQDGAVQSVLLRVEDVTAEVRSRQQKELIASELQHRMGNVLTLVQIVARKTAQNYARTDTFLPVFDDRIAALGKTHAFLSGVNWDGMTLRQLLHQQLADSSGKLNDAITLEGPDWRLSVLHAQAFAMAVHELSINSLKHGALGDDSGRILVKWDHPADGSYSFLWQERGLTDVREPTVSGFGSQMLSRLLPGQLGGTAVRAFTPTGFHYALVVPASAEVPVGQTRHS